MEGPWTRGWTCHQGPWTRGCTCQHSPSLCRETKKSKLLSPLVKRLRSKRGIARKPVCPGTERRQEWTCLPFRSVPPASMPRKVLSLQKLGLAKRAGQRAGEQGLCFSSPSPHCPFSFFLSPLSSEWETVVGNNITKHWHEL